MPDNDNKNNQGSSNQQQSQPKPEPKPNPDINPPRFERIEKDLNSLKDKFQK